jgi:predicted transcriptional regulator
MAVVSFRVPDDVRHRMDELDLDWPERLREFVEEELRRQESLAALDVLRAFRKKHAKAMKGISLSDEVIRSRYEEH